MCLGVFRNYSLIGEPPLKIVLMTFVSTKEAWFEEFLAVYEKKINPLMAFDYIGLKTPKLERGDASQKKKGEAELLLKQIKKDDLVVLLDEKGRALSSLQWAGWLEKEAFLGSYKRLVFIIGGAFGVDESVRAKARFTFQMGPWTFNHLVAQSVLMEQIYRSLTIIKGLPYHNS